MNDTKKSQDDRLKDFLAKNDAPVPEAPTAEWQAIRASALESKPSRRPFWKMPAFPVALATAALFAIAFFRAPSPAPAVSPISMAANPQEEEQIGMLLVDDSYFDEPEADETGYLALLQ